MATFCVYNVDIFIHMEIVIVWDIYFHVNVGFPLHIFSIVELLFDDLPSHFDAKI